MEITIRIFFDNIFITKGIRGLPQPNVNKNTSGTPTRRISNASSSKVSCTITVDEI